MQSTGHYLRWAQFHHSSQCCNTRLVLMLMLSISLGITFTVALQIFQLGYLTEVTVTQTNSSRRKRYTKKFKPITSRLLYTIFYKRGSNKKHLLSRTTKSFLGTKHQKLKIFLPNTSSYFRIKHIFPPWQVITFATKHLVSLQLCPEASGINDHQK